MNPDFVDLLRAFAAADVRFLVVGLPPGRIDILTQLTGLAFDEAWPDRARGRFADVDVDFIGRDAFIRNKKATGRTKDLGDIEDLG